MSRAALIARARAAAEAAMVDTCEIRRATGETGDGYGGTVTTWEIIYSGKCRVQQSPLIGNASPDTTGEAALLKVPRVLQLPVATSAGIRADDEATITAVGAHSDPGLLGRVFVVRGEYAKTDITSRRLGVEEITS